MTMAYFGCWDVADPFNALGTIRLKAAGQTDVVVDLTLLTAPDGTGNTYVSIFNHYFAQLQTTGGDKKATTHNSTFSSLAFEGALSNALNAEAIIQSWSGTLTENCDVTNFGTGSLAAPFCFFTASSETLTDIQFSTPQGAALFGFSGDWSGSALNTPVYGALVPNFIIVPTLTSTSAVAGNDAKDYEPDQISTQAITDNGEVYGLARTVAPLYRDWVQQFETRAKTERLFAVVGHPYTFQALIEDSRTYWPFVVWDGFDFGDAREAEVFFFRAEGSQYGKAIVQRASEGNSAQFHISFLTVCVGVPGGGGGGS